MRGLLLHGLGFVLCLRAEYAEALALAERADALFSTTHDPVLLLAACTVQAEVHMLQGRPRSASGWIERAFPGDDSGEAATGQTFVADPRVTLLGLLAIHLLHLGLVEQARERLREAYARAQRLEQPMARMVVLWFDALFEVRLGDAERVATIADAMQALVDEFALAQGQIACRWFRGWADARMGQPRDGYRRIRQAYEDNTRLGGDWDGAQRELDGALQFANARGERVYLPQLLLMQAALARARGERDAPQAAIRRAIAEAEAQQAPWLELMARIELCDRAGATDKERRALTALIDRLPEARDTAAVARARALLDKARSA
jgi:hypothetical protein